MDEREVMQLQNDLMEQFYSDEWDEYEQEAHSDVLSIVARALLGDMEAQGDVRKLVALVEFDETGDAV